MTRLRTPSRGLDCAFCGYLAGTRPYVFLWRERAIAVAVTREQRGVSHLLVMPVIHTPTLLNLPDSISEELMIAVRDAATAIHAADDRPGIAVWQNNGVQAGQAVPHLHFHVAGTIPDGSTLFGDVPEISLSEARSIATRLAPFVPVGRRRAKRSILI